MRKAALDGEVATLTSIIASGIVNIEAGHPKDGQTALMYASSNGHIDCIDVLLKAGSNLESRDKFGYTALMIAATTGEVEAIKFLLASGAELDARNRFGHTALAMAREEKHPDAVKLLEHHYALLGGDAAPTAVTPAAPMASVASASATA